jgi:cytochrome c-type biogenesis protein CcmE
MRLRKKQRLMLVVLALLLVGGATGLVLAALQDKVAFFVTPGEIAAGRVTAGKQFRIGGLVAEGSVRRGGDGTVTFALTDTSAGSTSPTAASSPTCSESGRASWRRARCAPTARSRRPRCWPSTTRTTCPRRWPTP